MSSEPRRHRRRLIALAALALGIAWGALPSGVHAEPAGPTATASLCQRAGDWTYQGYPQRALGLISSTRGDKAGGAASTEEKTACATQREAALQRVATAERLASLAEHAPTPTPPPPTASAPAGPAGPTSPSASATPIGGQTAGPFATLACSEPAADNRDALLAAALACDRENAAAKALEQTSTLQDRASEAWDDLIKTAVLPWQAIALAFLLWLAVAYLTVQIVTALPWRGMVRRPSAAPSPGSDTSATQGTGALGSVLLVFAGGLTGTLGVALYSAQGGPAAYWATLVGIVVTACGVWACAVVRRSRPRLQILVTGTTAAENVSDLRGVIGDMGGARPRGIETPRGSDTTFLKDVDLSVLDSSPVLKAVKTLLMAIKPYAPWQLVVDVVDGDRLACTLHRNGCAMASEVVDRTTLELDGKRLEAAKKSWVRLTSSGVWDEEDRGAPSLLPFAAALALTRMATAHGLTGGLAGASNWRSVALQYIATTHFRSSPIAGPLLGRAVDLDPGNLAAQYASAYERYRYAGSAWDLRDYLKLLATLREEIRQVQGGGRAEAALELRTLFALVATAVNLCHAIGKDDEPFGDHDKMNLKTWFDALKDLYLEMASTGGEREPSELAVSAAERIRTLERSVTRILNDQTPSEVLAFSPAWGPRGLYGAACALIPLTGQGFAEGAPTKAVAYLRAADVDAQIARWRPHDPQLAKLRSEQVYTDEFGKDVPTDLLELDAFAPYAARLKAAGLGQGSAIIQADLPWLGALGVPEVAACRLQQIATLALMVPHALGRWRIPITDFLVDLDILQVHHDHPEVTEDLLKALKPYKQRPDHLEEEALKRWLSPLPLRHFP